MKPCLASIALILAIGLLSRAADPAQVPAVDLRPSKEEYVSGEPIGVVLTIRNPGPLAAEFRLSYPFHFTREIKVLRFDGGRPMPPLEDRPMMFSGPIATFATKIPAGHSWSATVFLQNYLGSPPPGEYPVGWRFDATYRLGIHVGFRENDPFRTDYPSLTGEGSIKIRVGPADPVALDRAMKGFVGAFQQTEPGQPVGDRAAVAIRAFEAFGGPGVIPYVGAALRAIDRPDAPLILDLGDLFDVLEPFHDRKDARDVVLGLVSSEDSGLSSHALHWLRDGSVPVDPGVLVGLMDAANGRMESPHYVLLYLQDVIIPPTPALIERVSRCLSPEDLQEVAYALKALANWQVPPDPAIRKALDRIAGEMKRDRDFDLDRFLGVLGVWKYQLGVEEVRDLLDRQKNQAIPVYEDLCDYMRTIGVGPYRALEPRVALLLDHEFNDIALAALKVLEAMDHVLTPKEVKGLMDRGPDLRKATEAYLKRRPAA
jgi:hypothetical protein